MRRAIAIIVLSNCFIIDFTITYYVYNLKEVRDMSTFNDSDEIELKSSMTIGERLVFSKQLGKRIEG